MELNPDPQEPSPSTSSSSNKRLARNNDFGIPLEIMDSMESHNPDEFDKLLGAGDLTPEKEALTQQELLTLCMSVNDIMMHGKQPVTLSHVVNPLMMIPNDDEITHSGDMSPSLIRQSERPRRQSAQHWTQLPFSMYPSTISHVWTPGDETAAGMLRAIENNNIPQLLSYLDNNADPNATYPLTPIESQALCTLRWSDDLNTYQQTPTWEGPQAHWTMLQWASALCRGDAVRALIARGARAGTLRDGRNALDVAGASICQRRAGPHPTPSEFLEVVRILGRGLRCNSVPDTHGALHCAARLGCARAAAVLLGAGAAIDARDYSGFTALHIAVAKRAEDLFDLLLNYGLGVHDVEKRRERANSTDRSGASLLQLAAASAWPRAARRLLAAGADVAYHTTVARSRRVYGANYELDYTPLHLAVKNGNIEIFNNILEVAKQEGHIDSRSPAEPDTPLCVAIMEGNLEITRILIENGASLQNITSDRNNVLHVAAQWYNQNESILKYLLQLEQVRGLLNELNEVGDGPVHVATTVGMEPLLTLVYGGADIRLKDGKNGFTPLHKAAVLGLKELVAPIVFESALSIFEVDAKGRTPLHVATITPSKEVVLELLNLGATLGRQFDLLNSEVTTEVTTEGTAEGTTEGTTEVPTKVTTVPCFIKLITDNIPNPTEFFKEVFNGWVQRESKTGFCSQVVVNYKMLTKDDQLEVIEELIQNGHDKVLVHPVIETLLHLKWLSMLPVFLFILAINGIFVVALNVFAGAVFYYRDIQKAPGFASGVVCPTTIYCVCVATCTALIYLSFLVLVALEYVTIKAHGAAHWRHLESYVRISALAFGAALPAAALAAPTAEAPRWLATPALIAAWLAIMYLLARFPDWGYYFLMIGKVAANLAKVLLTCVLLIVAFAHVFMIHFHAEPPFDGPLVAFTKTFVMMTSEFEYENLFADNHTALQHSREWVRVIFIAFVFFLALVLMNVMLGVAVNDINDLTLTGNIRRLRKQTEILTTLEKLVDRTTVLSKRVSRNRFLMTVSIAPASETTWTVKQTESHYKTELPAHLHTNLIMLSKTAPIDGIKLMEPSKQDGLHSLRAELRELSYEMAQVHNYMREIMRKLDQS